jgi:hypothetical protein
LLALQGCGGDLLLPSSGEPSLIKILRGDLQRDTVGRPLPDSLVVEVLDPEGRQVEGVEVVFVAPAGSTLAPNDTVFTGPDGRAAILYTLPTASGPQSIEARATPVTPTTSLTTTFNAVAEPEQATTLLKVAGDSLVAEVQTALPESLVVRAVDRFGNGVAGVNVSWSASEGSVSAEVVTTGADGRAAVQRTLGGRPGAYQTVAEAPELEGSPIVFEATGIAPPTPQLVLVTQPSENARAGLEFERQPVVQLQTPSGAPFAQADVAVTAQIVEGGGSLGGTTTQRSDADGRVRFTDLSIRGQPGTRTLLFAAPDFSPATSGEIDVGVGLPAAERTTASVGNGTAGQPTTVSIRLRDEFGTDVEQAADAIRVSIGGANSGTADVTDTGDGSYTATYTPRMVGTDEISIEVRGAAIPSSPLSSSVSPGPSSPARTTASFARNSLIFLSVGVVVRDDQGNLVGRGGDDVRLQFGDGPPIPLTDEGDGSYTGNFAAGFSTQIVTVYLNGVPIAGSPFSV